MGLASVKVTERLLVLAVKAKAVFSLRVIRSIYFEFIQVEELEYKRRAQSKGKWTRRLAVMSSNGNDSDVVKFTQLNLLRKRCIQSDNFGGRRGPTVQPFIGWMEDLIWATCCQWNGQPE